MTSSYHTPLAFGGPLTSAAMESPLSELDTAIVDLFSGASKKALNGGFTNSYDTDLWIARAQRSNPSLNAQALYAQLRVTGNMGALTHDGGAFEIRVNAATNTTFLNALEAGAIVTGGANTISDMRAFTANFHTEGTPSGTITAVKVIQAQTIPALTGTIAITTAYSLYVEAQTVAATNYSIYAPTGLTHLGTLEVEGDVTLGLNAAGVDRIIHISRPAGKNADLRFDSSGSVRWILRVTSGAESGSNAGSDFQLMARDDSGGAIATVLTITRSTGGVGFANTPIGFFGTSPQSKKTVTGSRASNAALASLLTQLAGYGLLTDSTTA